MIIATVETDSGALLQIGRQGEHDARQVWFDLTWLVENFGEGEAVLVHQRTNDEAPYICQTTREENRLIWVIDEIDTAYEGFGKAEIRWTVDGALAKTVIYKTSVMKSLTGDTVIPDPYESWYDRMMDKIGDNEQYAEEARQSAEDAEATAQRIEGDTFALAVTDYGEGVVQITGAGTHGIQIVKGDTGAKGEIGDDGKSAYQYAVDGGYTGTEVEFSELLAECEQLKTHKVAQPLDQNNHPTNGTDGQMLRTKGNGTTEWASVGLPTDSQTAEAVYDWLNEHPEATTTVEDGSLTLPKFKTGELPFVTPEMFGAIGNGINDDTQAWQDAVDSGFNVIATKKIYKCGEIEVTNNIEIDFNGANFICTNATFLHCHGEVITTLKNQNNYDANDSLYSIIDEDYSAYTGFAMLKGTNNFEESRSYYIGGFVCTFKNGFMNGSYPISVTKEDGIDIDIIDPITVRLFNLGKVTHDITSGDSIIIEYGINCLIENVNADSVSKYVFINLKRSLNCVCNQINAAGILGSRGTNSYLIALSDSSYCVVENSYLYNKYWHAVTTGANYLCFHNMVLNSKLFSDAIAYCDHENAKNTIIKNCVVSTAGISGMGVIEDTVVIANGRPSNYECGIGIYPASDPGSTGATVRNIKLIPHKNSTESLVGITIGTFPQVTGRTYYIDNIQIENVETIDDHVGQLRFTFTASTVNNYVGKSIKINNTNLHITLGSSLLISSCFDISGYDLEVSNINKRLKNQAFKNVMFGNTNEIYNNVSIHNCRFHSLRGLFDKLEAHNVYSLISINNSIVKFKTFIGSGLDFDMSSPNVFISDDPDYPASYVRITDINNQRGNYVMFNVASDNAGNKYYQRWIDGVLTTNPIT